MALKNLACAGILSVLAWAFDVPGDQFPNGAFDVLPAAGTNGAGWNSSYIHQASPSVMPGPGSFFIATGNTQLWSSLPNPCTVTDHTVE